MAEQDDPLAKLGRELNEDAKANRKRGGKAGATEAAKQHLYGDDTEGAGADETRDALQSLGDAIDRQPDAATGGYDLSEESHRLAVERIEGLVMDQKFEGKTLVFDVRDTLLGIVKARPKPWSATSQDEQNDIAAALEQAAIKMVRRIVETVAADGKPPIRMLLTRINQGDDVVITGKLKVFEAEAEDEALMALSHARGKHVLLTAASVDDYRQTERAAQTDADQPGFGFEAGSDNHPDDDSDLNPGDDDEGGDD